MNLNGFYTQKGLALAAKLLTGSTLVISRVVSGSGKTAENDSSFSSPCQTLSVGSPESGSNTVVLPVTLVAASASADYTLTEVAVYAMDPDEGEILYQIYQMDLPVDINTASPMVLRFYLQEVLQELPEVQVVCSPAGLITEETFFPLRDAVLAANIPTLEVTLDAAEVQSYLDNLPRLITEHIILNVSGTAPNGWEIADFYGSGSLTIQASQAGTCTVKNHINIYRCKLLVKVINISCDYTGATTSNFFSTISYSTSVHFVTCSFIGSNRIGSAIFIAGFTTAYFEDCSIKNTATAFMVSKSGTGYLYSSGTYSNLYSNNSIGAYPHNGGTIYLCGTTPTTVGAAANSSNHPGLLVGPTGTLI